MQNRTLTTLILCIATGACGPRFNATPGRTAQASSNEGSAPSTPLQSTPGDSRQATPRSAPAADLASQPEAESKTEVASQPSTTFDSDLEAALANLEGPKTGAVGVGTGGKGMLVGGGSERTSGALTVTGSGSGRAERVDAAYDKEAAKRLILKEARRCFTDAPPGPAHKLRVQLRVKSDGSAHSLKVTTSETRSRKRAACIKTVITRLRFPRPRDGRSSGLLDFTFLGR